MEPSEEPKDTSHVHTTARIGLIGQLGTGKSFVAKRLARVLEADVISFGREVYNVAEQALGRTIDKKRPEDRQMLTDVGTHWGRNGEAVDAALEARLTEVWPYAHGYPNIWVDALDRRIAKNASKTSLVLDDLRFPNEMKFLLEQRFCIFLVQCDLTTRTQRLQQRGDPYATTVDDHPSEKLASWLSRLSRSKTVVPTIWNDQLESAPASGDGLLVTMPQLEAALRDKDYGAMLSVEEHAATWRNTLESFEI